MMTDLCVNNEVIRMEVVIHVAVFMGKHCEEVVRVFGMLLVHFHADSL